MPFTNSPLADAELDAMLGGAAGRLVAVADGLSVGPPPAPSSAVGPRLATVAAVGLATAGLAAVLAVSNRSRPAVLPPGFTNGARGTEVTIEEVDDGDGNPDTIQLRTRPFTGAGVVTIRRNGAAEPATTSATAPADSAVPPPAPSTDLCVESPTAGGACGTFAQMAEPMLHVGQRGPDGSVMVTGVPDDVVAVAFTAGTERHWQRPVEGVALFPLDGSAPPDVVVSLVRADGSEAVQLTGTDGSITDAEAAAHAITTPTGLDLPTLRLASATTDLTSTTGVWLRRIGRPTATSFAGPFAIQGFGAGGQGDGAAVFLVTVRTDQADDARERLALATAGTIRRAVDEGDGTTVLVWARPATTDGQIDALVVTLAVREPAAEEAIDLTRPWAWHGQRTGPYASTEVDATMFGVPVGSVDLAGRSRRVWATADDLGAVRFASLSDVADPASLASGLVAQTGRPALPLAGDRLLVGQLVAVPSTVTSLTITFEDGTVVTPTLLDVRPVVDAKLALVATNGTIGSVESS